MSTVLGSETSCLGTRPKWKVGNMEIMNVDTVLGRERASMVIGGLGSYIVFCFSDGRILSICIGQGEEAS